MRRVLRNAWLQAVVIFVGGVALGAAAGTFLSSVASEAGASADMVFLASVVPAAIFGLVGGYAAATLISMRKF